MLTGNWKQNLIRSSTTRRPTSSPPRNPNGTWTALPKVCRDTSGRTHVTARLLPDKSIELTYYR